MTQDTTYNGWTNYATWRVNLEFFDGLDLRDIFPQMPKREDVDAYLEEALNEHLETCGSGLSLDYARAFISDVDFSQISDHLIEAAEYEEAE